VLHKIANAGSQKVPSLKKNLDKVKVVKLTEQALSSAKETKKKSSSTKDKKKSSSTNDKTKSSSAKDKKKSVKRTDPNYMHNMGNEMASLFG
jgi:transposase